MKVGQPFRQLIIIPSIEVASSYGLFSTFQKTVAPRYRSKGFTSTSSTTIIQMLLTIWEAWNYFVQELRVRCIVHLGRDIGKIFYAGFAELLRQLSDQTRHFHFIAAQSVKQRRVQFRSGRSRPAAAFPIRLWQFSDQTRHFHFIAAQSVDSGESSSDPAVPDQLRHFQ